MIEAATRRIEVHEWSVNLYTCKACFRKITRTARREDTTSEERKEWQCGKLTGSETDLFFNGPDRFRSDRHELNAHADAAQAVANFTARFDQHARAGQPEA